MRSLTDLRLRLAGLALGFAAIFGSAATAEAQQVLTLSYSISVAGVRVGGVEVDGRFVDGRYAVALFGSTSGVSRFVSDAATRMAAGGTILGSRVLPARFEIEMSENGIAATAQMQLANRGVMDLFVLPGLVPSLDRVPLTMDHVGDVLDPMSALFVAIGHGGEVGGEEACNRTLPVFDGWQRFDLEMAFVVSRTVIGQREGYSGTVHVCSVRYLPIAGHRISHPSVLFMSQNDRLEAWLIPVPSLGILIPSQLLVGTTAGDLTISLDRMRVSAGADQAR